MSTGQSIERLYKAIEKVAGPVEAKNSVSDVVFISISRLQDEGIQVTEQSINEYISKFADDFIEASKSEVA